MCDRFNGLNHFVDTLLPCKAVAPDDGDASGWRWRGEGDGGDQGVAVPCLSGRVRQDTDTQIGRDHVAYRFQRIALQHQTFAHQLWASQSHLVAEAMAAV